MNGHRDTSQYSNAELIDALQEQRQRSDDAEARLDSLAKTFNGENHIPLKKSTWVIIFAIAALVGSAGIWIGTATSDGSHLTDQVSKMQESVDGVADMVAAIPAAIADLKLDMARLSRAQATTDIETVRLDGRIDGSLQAAEASAKACMGKLYDVEMIAKENAGRLNSLRLEFGAMHPNRERQRKED